MIRRELATITFTRLKMGYSRRDVFHKKEKDEISSSAISKDDSISSRVVVERQLRRDWSLAEKRLEMLSAPHTESTMGEEEEDLLELIRLT